jgi:glutaredoxin
MYIIYTISDCKYCQLAKELLEQYNEPKIIILCDNMISNPYLKRDFIESMNDKIKRPLNKLTFPIIFLDDSYIGGYNLLKEHLETDDILKQYVFNADF